MSLFRASVAFGLLAVCFVILDPSIQEPCQIAGRYHQRTRTTRFFERVPHAGQPASLDSISLPVLKHQFKTQPGRERVPFLAPGPGDILQVGLDDDPR